MQKLLKLDRLVAERFYAPYRKQFNPDLTVSDVVVEVWDSVGTLEQKKNTAKPQQVVDWTFAERSPTLNIKIRD